MHSALESCQLSNYIILNLILKQANDIQCNIYTGRLHSSYQIVLVQNCHHKKENIQQMGNDTMLDSCCIFVLTWVLFRFWRTTICSTYSWPWATVTFRITIRYRVIGTQISLHCPRIFVIVTKRIKDTNDLVEYAVGDIGLIACGLICQDCTHFGFTTFPVVMESNSENNIQKVSKLPNILAWARVK